MRILLITLALTFLFSTPTLADIEVGDIVINRTSGSVNVRINMHNPGPSTARSPILVKLFVMGTEDGEWREVKRWTNIQKLAVGHRVSRDYFNDSPGDWDPAFQSSTFLVRATAESSNGVEASYEREFSGNIND